MANDRFVARVEGLSQFTEAPKRGWLRVHADKVIAVTFKNGQKVENEYTRLIDRILLVLQALFSRQFRFSSSVEKEIKQVDSDLRQAAEELSKKLASTKPRSIAESQELARDVRTVLLAERLLQRLSDERDAPVHLGGAVAEHVDALKGQLKEGDVSGEDYLLVTAELFVFIERLKLDTVAQKDLATFKNECKAVIHGFNSRLNADVSALERRKLNDGTFYRMEKRPAFLERLTEYAKDLKGTILGDHFTALAQMVEAQLDVTKRRLAASKETLDGKFRPAAAELTAMAKTELEARRNTLKTEGERLDAIVAEQKGRQDAAKEALEAVNRAHLAPYSSDLVKALENPWALLSNREGFDALSAHRKTIQTEMKGSNAVRKFEKLQGRTQAARDSLVAGLNKWQAALPKEEKKSIDAFITKLEMGTYTPADVEWAVAGTASLAGIEGADGASLSLGDLREISGPLFLMVSAAIELRDLPSEMVAIKGELEAVNPLKLFVSEADKILKQMQEYQDASDQLAAIATRRSSLIQAVREKRKSVHESAEQEKRYAVLSGDHAGLIKLLSQ